MIAVQLDERREQRLRQLAEELGEDVAILTGRIIEDYLDFRAWPRDSAEHWADASIALAPEIFTDEPWSATARVGSSVAGRAASSTRDHRRSTRAAIRAPGRSTAARSIAVGSPPSSATGRTIGFPRGWIAGYGMPCSRGTGAT